jgi:hypothetical protein
VLGAHEVKANSASSASHTGLRRVQSSREDARVTGKLFPFIVLRLLLAITLSSAAVLKGRELAHAWGWSPEWFLIAVEGILSIWLLSGYRWPLLRMALAAWFAALAGASTVKILRGEDSCGCFGAVQVSPWITLGIDAAALVALGLATSGSFGALRRAGLIAAQLAIVAMLGFVALALRAPTESSGLVSLEPSDWIGKPWPLMQYVDRRDAISRGKWVVLLYTPQCRNCMAAIEEYDDLSATWRAKSLGAHVALIDVTASTSEADAANFSALSGNLNAPPGWLIHTPTIVLLKDGAVMHTCQTSAECQSLVAEFVNE